MPGAINAVVPARRAAPRVPRRVSEAVTASVATNVPVRRVSPRAPSSSVPLPSAKKDTPDALPVSPPPPTHPSVLEEYHWVYATVDADLRSSGDEGGVVFERSARVLLAYPMVADSETGIVRMKVKRVDADTGQMEWHWVNVYDPNTDTRYVSHFSFLP